MCFYCFNYYKIIPIYLGTLSACVRGVCVHFVSAHAHMLGCELPMCPMSLCRPVYELVAVFEAEREIMTNIN